MAQVDAAEALGMDSIWMVEQHFRPWASLLPSPMILASAIASRTQRVRIGLAVQACTARPMRTRCVRDAMALARIMGEGRREAQGLKCCSTIQMESMPRASAAST